MKVLLKNDLLILVPERTEECAELTEWKAGHEGHVLAVRAIKGEGLALGDLGPRDEACREPLNVTSTSPDPVAQWISNFAPTPFTLDGQGFACVEGFWQGLKFARESERRRLAAMDGHGARQAGQEQGYGVTIEYQGRQIAVGTWEHWQLMERACWAKFSQHAEARAALLATGERPLQHRMRRDSRTIPGVIMAEIWMKIRGRLRAGKEQRD